MTAFYVFYNKITFDWRLSDLLCETAVKMRPLI